MPISSLYIYIKYIGFDWVWVFYGISTIVGYFNAKSSLYIYIKYIWFGLVGFYGISTIVGYFNAKFSLYIYIKYIWFGLVGLGFYGISTIVRLFNAKFLFIHIKYIIIWLGWVLWHINHCRLFNAKSSLYIKYI